MDGPDQHARERQAALATLLCSVAAGDAAAFEELYRVSAPKLFGICRRILSGRTDAEEALQDSFVNIWRKAGNFDPDRGSALAWMAALTRNRAIDRLRAGSSAQELPIFEQNEDVAGAAAEHEAAAKRRELGDCLRLLDPRDGTWITAAFFRGETYADLAEAAKLPLGTVKTRIRRALLKLRECLA